VKPNYWLVGEPDYLVGSSSHRRHRIRWATGSRWARGAHVITRAKCAARNNNTAKYAARNI